MRLMPILLFLFFGAAGCAPQARAPSAEESAAARAVFASLNDAFQVMATRFPPGNLGTDAERQAAAGELIREHTDRRAALGLPYASTTLQLEDTRALVGWPASNARFEAENQNRQRTRNSAAQVAAFDGRQVSHADVARIASARLDAERPDLRGSERRIALAEVDAEVRLAFEQRRRNMAATAVTGREIELTRLAGSNLADMPREIIRAAEENLADGRSPFDTRPNWRAEPAALRREEVRLRAAIAQRIEANLAAAQVAAAASANAARRDAVLQQCRMQAAMAGASVPSPYMGRGFGGAIASGIAGAMRSAEMENNVLRACLAASGY